MEDAEDVTAPKPKMPSRFADLTPAERFGVCRLIAAADAALAHVSDQEKAEALASSLQWAYLALPVAMDFVSVQGGVPYYEVARYPGEHASAISAKRWREAAEWAKGEIARLNARIAELESTQ